MNYPLLFYSSKCPHCKEILNLLHNVKLDIKLISIEEIKKIPSYLKVVPTLLKGPNSQPITGSSVFEWFKEFERNNTSNAPQSNQSNQSNQLSNQSNQLSNKPISSGKNDSIEPFFNNEMAGFSDNYSYLGNDAPINHSYQFLNSNMSSSDKKFNEPQSNKEKSFNKNYEKLMEARKNDIAIPNTVKRV